MTPTHSQARVAVHRLHNLHPLKTTRETDEWDGDQNQWNQDCLWLGLRPKSWMVIKDQHLVHLVVRQCSE